MNSEGLDKKEGWITKALKWVVIPAVILAAFTYGFMGFVAYFGAKVTLAVVVGAVAACGAVIFRDLKRQA